MQKFTLLAVCLLLVITVKAQTWTIGGNNLSAAGSIGTNSNHSLLFKTNKTVHGRITGAGQWSIGTSVPNAKFVINSAVGESPLRVKVNNETKFIIHNNGSVGIGTSTPNASDRLSVINKDSLGTGIYTVGYDFGLVSQALQGSYSIGVIGMGFGAGVHGRSDNGWAVYGYTDGGGEAGYFVSSTGYGIYATSLNKEGEYAAYFQGDVYTDGIFSGSDKNIKKNIKGVDNALSLINRLQPKHYEFKDDGNYASLRLPKGNHYGLLAQDVEQVLPHLVKETMHKIKSNPVNMVDGKPVLNETTAESISIKAVNYTELITVLIKAVQEQDQKITSLTDEVQKLKAGSTFNTGITLEQNHPNPVINKTTFKYSLPLGSAGEIMIYEALTGRLVKTLPVVGSSVELDGASLPGGTYVYSLMVNGQLAGSRQLVVKK